MSMLVYDAMGKRMVTTFGEVGGAIIGQFTQGTFECMTDPIS
jgi:hypothetical protein